MMKRHNTIRNAKSALLRAVAVVLSLALFMSGMTYGVGSHGADHAGPSLAVIALHDATSPTGECDDSSNHAFNETCCQAAGCAFAISAQTDVEYEPLQHGETVRATAEVHHGTTAAPPVPPPKLAVQA
jgi:hypothetical protein